MTQKAFTHYECESGEAGLGHSGRYTGAHPSEDQLCSCGKRLVEAVPGGFRYKVVFETIDSFQAADMVAQFGKDVWARLSDAEWNNLKWLPPVTSDQARPAVLRDQYKRLLEDSETHRQPIRNVHFYKTTESDWEEETFRRD